MEIALIGCWKFSKKHILFYLYCLVTVSVFSVMLICCKNWIFFYVGPLKEDIFLTTFYGLYFSHLHTYALQVSSWASEDSFPCTAVTSFILVQLVFLLSFCKWPWGNIYSKLPRILLFHFWTINTLSQKGFNPPKQSEVCY